MAPYLGAEFTFASPGGGSETAPGQLDMKQLIELYKVIDKS
jgi:3-dehydroquinate dehydratase